jgi:hypothetical protein
MNYEYKHPVIRDGWGRSRISHMPKSEAHWINRRTGAVYKSDGPWVSVAIHRRGRVCWNHLGSYRHNMHAISELANQYHEKMSEALDDSLYCRDIMRI